MKIRGAAKYYGEVCALAPLDLDLEEGKITAVLGESGAGKTTLLNVLAGLVPHEGEVERRAVSYLFQSPKLLPHLTVEDNLRFVLNKSDYGKIAQTLCDVGLGGKEKSLPNALSGGERQRVAIARAFLYPHELLLMDEPFSSLDLSLKKTLVELVVSLWKKSGQTVVFVTHDVHEATLLSHRALVLSKGALIGDYPVEGELPRDFFTRHPAEETLVRALMHAPKGGDAV